MDERTPMDDAVQRIRDRPAGIRASFRFHHKNKGWHENKNKGWHENKKGENTIIFPVNATEYVEGSFPKRIAMYVTLPTMTGVSQDERPRSPRF
jgi:hypothetical protein